MRKNSSPVVPVFVLLVVLGGMRPMGAAVLQDEKDKVQFKWGFGVIAGKGENQRFVAITRDTTLKTGDELKMFVEPVQECFVYVLHHGPEGEVTLLFPYEFSQFTSDYRAGKGYNIPKGRFWLALDKNVGKETIYLLASAKRLTAIEGSVTRYKEAQDSNKADRAGDVLAEIRNVRRQYTTLATVAERPISIGGNVRGGGKKERSRPDIASIAVEISAPDFYSKTFTIDHE